jgi:hypothetical protein
MEAAVWRCHGLFASKSSAAAQEGNPGARALLKKSSVEGKGLDETMGELASASRKVAWERRQNALLFTPLLRTVHSNLMAFIRLRGCWARRIFRISPRRYQLRHTVS